MITVILVIVIVIAIEIAECKFALRVCRAGSQSASPKSGFRLGFRVSMRGKFFQKGSVLRDEVSSPQIPLRSGRRLRVLSLRYGDT